MAGKDDDTDVLGDVFASDRDRGADTAAPESDTKAETRPEPEAKAPETKDEPDAKGEDSSKQYRDPETGRFVPLHELKTERSKRQEEARLREEAERRAADYQRRLDDLERRIHAQQQPQPVRQPPPDMYADPEGYQAYVTHQAHVVALNERLNMSQAMAEDKFGSEVVEKALNAAIQAGVGQHFMNHRHPYAEIVKWHQRASKLQTIGDDFEGYEKRIRDEERQRVMAELKQGSKGQPQRFPGTLADATASGSQGAMLTDEAMMADVFGSDRRTRRRA